MRRFKKEVHTDSFLLFATRHISVVARLDWLAGDLNPPTLDVASVKLLRVVLLPAEGLPTRPTNGSRGIVKGKGEK